uniref:Nucleotidyltransferase domain-containing protein n=1 Tax=Candidatus Kentrum sp. FW TaxID=2126338 RepID=A0A450SQU2_9GAMM|nr:MAG: Nucleotidyltransferase domain-containing protein [Candidatus Kentron sp. FW]
MRLTERQQKTIRDAAVEIFGSKTKVRLFGSRLDDHKKGGDIDLLVECSSPMENPGLAAARMAAKIQFQLGERKIDILYTWPGHRASPIHEAAGRQGILL